MLKFKFGGSGWYCGLRKNTKESKVCFLGDYVTWTLNPVRPMAATLQHCFKPKKDLKMFFFHETTLTGCCWTEDMLIGVRSGHHTVCMFLSGLISLDLSKFKAVKHLKYSYGLIWMSRAHRCLVVLQTILQINLVQSSHLYFYFTFKSNR